MARTNARAARILRQGPAAIALLGLCVTAHADGESTTNYCARLGMYFELPSRTVAECVPPVGRPSWQWVRTLGHDSHNRADAKANVNAVTGVVTANRDTSAGGVQGAGVGNAVADLEGRFLYAAMPESNRIAGYAVDPATGARSPLPNAPYVAGSEPRDLVVSPSNRFVYAVNAASGTVTTFRIDPATGALISQATSSTIPGASSIAMHPSGAYLYVIGVRRQDSPFGFVSTLVGHTVDPLTGGLGPPTQPRTIGGLDTTGHFVGASPVVDATGRFLYLAAQQRVEAYAIGAAGSLAPVPGSPFAAPLARRLAAARGGRFVYTINVDAAAGGASTIAGFVVDAATGALSGVSGGAIATADHASWLVTDASGRFVVVASAGSSRGSSDAISAYVVDGESGVLSSVSGSPFVLGGGASPDVVALVAHVTASYAVVDVPFVGPGMVAIGGTAPYAWNVSEGTLPPGIALHPATGALSGTPTVEGTYAFTMSVVDAAGILRQRARYLNVSKSGAPPGMAAHAPNPVAVEYFHKSFGHYFVTTLVDEIRKLDDGTFAGWQRTGQNFMTYALATAGAADVCRFFGTSFGTRSSHFYTPSAAECATVKTNPDWQFEALVFGWGVPGAVGDCAPEAIPLYRLYNDGRDGAPNHRYTTDLATQAAMRAAGWIPEGASDLGVIGCVPR